jgi:hypothetical protein
MIENIITQLGLAAIGTFFGAYFAFALQSRAERGKERRRVLHRLQLILEDMRKAERFQIENVKKTEWLKAQDAGNHLIPRDMTSLPLTYFPGIDYVEILRFTDKELVDHLRNVQTYLFPNWDSILNGEVTYTNDALIDRAKATLLSCQKVIGALENSISRVEAADDFQEI